MLWSSEGSGSLTISDMMEGTYSQRLLLIDGHCCHLTEFTRQTVKLTTDTPAARQAEHTHCHSHHTPTCTSRTHPLPLPPHSYMYKQNTPTATPTTLLHVQACSTHKYAFCCNSSSLACGVGQQHVHTSLYTWHELQHTTNAAL